MEVNLKYGFQKMLPKFIRRKYGIEDLTEKEISVYNVASLIMMTIMMLLIFIILTIRCEMLC